MSKNPNRYGCMPCRELVMNAGGGVSDRCKRTGNFLSDLALCPELDEDAVLIGDIREMTSHELAKRLLEQDDKPVRLFWDGSARGEVEGIVDTGETMVLIGEWSIYEKDFDREKVLYNGRVTGPTEEKP